MIRRELNNSIAYNFGNVRYWMLIPPFIILSICLIYFFVFSSSNMYQEEYVNIQKDLFYFLNSHLSKFATLQINLTQIGDVLISFSFIVFFLFITPKLWEGLLTSAILSLIASASLKAFFSMPRPAEKLDPETFTIIGEKLVGFSSLPSGHSISTFVLFSILIFGFMPRKSNYKVIWIAFMILLGLIIASSRIAVGAHHPIDVIVGSSIGYIVTVLGIKLNEKYNWLFWLKSPKCRPYFIVVLLVWSGVIINKLIENSLVIFYLSLLSLLFSLLFIIKPYVKKN